MIVGLIGAPGSGKGEVANFFSEHLLFKSVAFADKIKEGYYLGSGFNEEQFKLSRGTELELEIRQGLWKYSETVCKEFGDDYFIKQALKNINGDSIITDIRTPLELDTLESGYNPKIFLVIRNFKEELGGKFLPGTKLLLERTIGYQKIWNIGSIDDLYSDLYKIIQGDKMDSDSEVFG